MAAVFDGNTISNVIVVFYLVTELSWPSVSYPNSEFVSCLEESVKFVMCVTCKLVRASDIIWCSVSHLCCRWLYDVVLGFTWCGYHHSIAVACVQ